MKDKAWLPSLPPAHVRVHFIGGLSCHCRRQSKQQVEGASAAGNQTLEFCFAISGIDMNRMPEPPSPSLIIGALTGKGMRTVKLVCFSQLSKETMRLSLLSWPLTCPCAILATAMLIPREL